MAGKKIKHVYTIECGHPCMQVVVNLILDMHAMLRGTNA